MSIQIDSKLPNVGTTIFSVMSKLANEHNAINLSQGFPDFDCNERLKELVSHYLINGKNQYVPMPGVPILRERLAKKVEKLYNFNINADTEITITAGATQAIFTTITTFIKNGDEVILIEPAYDCYKPAIELVGGQPVVYELSYPDYKVNWDDFAKLITDKTKMIIFNTPHNPVGKIWEEEDLKALEKLVVGNDILVLSDEVYEHLIFDNKTHQSVLRYPRLFQQSLITYSFGKTLHSTGWKMGYCIAPEYLMKEFRKVHQFNVFSVNSFVQYGIADYIADENTYLGLGDFYQKKRDSFIQQLNQSKLTPIPCEGTYFQLVNYSTISDLSDIEFAQYMTTDIGVAVIPISAFYSSGKDEKVVRICFAKQQDTLEKAGKLLLNC